MNNYNNRVVITGIGILSPLGTDTASTWQGLISGHSGIDYITLFDASQLRTQFGGEVKGFNPEDYISRKDVRRMDRFAQLAVAAAKQAAEQSKILTNSTNTDAIGTIVGSAIGGMTTLFHQMRVFEAEGPGKVSPFLVPMMINDMAAGQISISLDLKGPNFCTTSACSSGSDAIGIAFETIKRGDAKAVFTGGSESISNPLGYAAFNALKALSTKNENPKKASRPFDAQRDGFVMSEGAAIMVLENLEYALKRGADIIAEVISYGDSGDAYHVTQPREGGEGAARAIKMALDKAGISPAEVGYINAHGTSTQLNDKTETQAIKSVFGEYAYKIPVSSTKSMTGHLIGAAGAIEASICALAIKNGIIPPTINYQHPDPDCDLDYVPNKARQVDINYALSNSFGFGGHNSVLLLKKYSEG
jgi:3-oxoacyl-[acyl-carrier-protein] synthase II